MSGNNESASAMKAFEAKVRRMARRQNLSVVKSRSPLVVQTYGGYMLCDGRNCIVAGATPNAYGMQIHQVFEYLSGAGEGVLAHFASAGQRRLHALPLAMKLPSSG